MFILVVYMNNITKSQKNIIVVFSVAMILTIGAVAPGLTNVAFASNWWDKYFNDDNGGNSIEQSIKQSQESDQDSQVVSGDDSEFSGNNINVQNQDNEGSNVAGQSN